MRPQSIETIFAGKLSNQDLTWVTLRGHVFVEAMLRRAVEERVPNPGSIAKLNLKFSKLVHLAVALGTLPPEFEHVLFKLDSLRNRLGHELRVTVSRSDSYGLTEALPVPWRAWMEQRYDGDEKFVHYIRDVVNLIVLIIYFGNDDVMAVRETPEMGALRDRFASDVLTMDTNHASAYD